MKKIIPLIIIIAMALFLTGCADVFIHVETDGKGNLLTETYEILSQDSTIGTQLSSSIAETYEEYNDRQRQCVKVDYYRREAPFGGKIHIDHKKARDLGIELTDTSIAFEDINYGIVDGIEFVTYRIPPDPDQAEQIISGTGFLTITTSMPGREEHQFGRGLEKVLKEGVYYTVRSDGTEETLKLSLFEDPNLEQVVREDIDKPTGLLYKADLEGITILDASEREIESLDGIQYIKNLQKLNFSSNQVSDISPLANLTNLEVLVFSGNQVSDISPLANLTILEQLQFHKNQVSDISPLANLTNLEVLVFSENQVSDISPLANLTILEQLQFHKNQVTNISPLANLTNLKWLLFYGNQVSDISALTNLPNLRLLSLDDNQVSDISVVQNLPNLEGLGFSDNQVSDISVVQNLPNLEGLGFSDNQVSDITPLANLTNLEWLRFSDNQVLDISALALNEGIGSGDTIQMENNYLDLTSGSQNMQDIETLINRGVDVIYEPQRVPNPTIELIPKTFDLGDIAKIDEKEQIIQFTILNTGDADLVVEEIVMENIFSFNREIPLTLEPGKQIQAVILLDASQLKEGELRKAIRIMTNDPQNQEIFLRITAFVR
jgi:Leucine-rich repeat (LRR) protein